MHSPAFIQRSVSPLILAFVLIILPCSAGAQTVVFVDNVDALRTAISAALPGDTITLTADITLTAELPSLAVNLTIDGNGHTLSGAGQFRGLTVVAFSGAGAPVPQPVSVRIQNLTIANTVATGGAGGSGTSGGGGGGAGLGGAIYVGDLATVTLTRVSIVSSGAVGGSGGSTTGGPGGGGGGGIGGGGGDAGGGGGGFGLSAAGGSSGPGGDGILTGAGSGGFSSAPGGLNGGGGGYGFGGGGGGVGGGGALSGFAGAGGYGGGGGGGDLNGTGASGGFGGGGGAGTFSSGSGGFGGGGAGGVGTTVGGFGGGGGAALAAGGGGGGGAALGGAIFVQSGGALVINDALTVNGSSVVGGIGGSGAGNGAAYGSGLYLDGSGTINFATPAGATALFADSIVDGAGVGGAGVWGLAKSGAGTLILSGANLYSGSTSVMSGTLSVTSNGNLGTGGLLSLGRTATLQITGSSVFTRQLYLDGTPTVSVASGQAATWAGGIFDANLPTALRVTGGGSLALTGSNSYSGGTIVTGGSSVIVNSDATLGNRLGALTLGDAFSAGTLGIAPGTTMVSGRNVTLGSAPGGVIDVQSGSWLTLTGLVSGAGLLTKSGSGTLTLAGSSTYAGGTLVAGGTLRAGSSGAFGGGNMTVAGGATLDLNGFSHTFGVLSGGGNVALGSATLTTGGSNGDALFSGAISGSGSLVKTGSATLALTGVNTYTGGTVVLAGALVGNTTSLQGDIVNNGVVAFDQAADGTYAGSMSGSGVLQKSGSGTLTLTGNNTNTGGIIVAAGSLTGRASSFSGTIANFGSLVFGGSADDTLGAILSGNGALTKTGTGTLTINSGQFFGGTTTVSQGTLAMNGALGGHVFVAPGATFRASGVLGGSADIGGTLVVPSPFPIVVPIASASRASGAMAQTADLLTTPPLLTISGDLIARPGSILSIPVAPGPYPSILVGGTAELNGTHLDLLAADLGNERTVSFLALDALRGLTMTNTGASTQSALIVPTLLQSGNSLYVTLLNMAAPLTLAVTSPNYASVAGAIDRLKSNLSGDRGVVIRELMALDDHALNAALPAIAGEVYASSMQTEMRSGEVFTDLIRESIMERDHEAGPGQIGWGGEPIRWWGEVAYTHGAIGAASGTLGGSLDTTDGAGGFDWRLSERWLLGAGGGFGGGQVGLHGVSASTDFSTPRAFGLVGFKPKAFGLRAGGSLARSRSQTKRTISYIAKLPLALGGLPLTGGIDREALGEEISILSDQWGEYADDFEFKTYRFDYMIGIRRARLARNGFLESGAGALSLELLDQVLNLSQADVKLHLWRREGNTRPFIETMFRRELTSGRTRTALRLAQDAQGAFEVQGWPAGGNTFAGRAGVTLPRRAGKLTLEYRIRMADHQTVHAVNARARF